MEIRNKKKWNRFPDNIPPDVPEEEDFGVEYVIQYLLPNGKTQTTIAEWLPEKSWNCIYPVLAWHEYAPVSAHDPPVLHMKINASKVRQDVAQNVNIRYNTQCKQKIIINLEGADFGLLLFYP